jgi:hypothetical protein
MTTEELQKKWPRSEFEQWQREGFLHQTLTYEQYLKFRRAQQAESEQQLRELTERYGKPPGEQPPELTAEEERDLQAAWDSTRAARTPKKNVDQPERIAA